MEIFLIIVVSFIAGFVIGEGFVLYKLRHSLRTLAESQGIDVDREIEKLEREKAITVYNIKDLIIEQVNDMLYLYDRNDDSFVCQAGTLDELAKLSKVQKNIEIATVIHQDKVFIFRDGNVQEYTK